MGPREQGSGPPITLFAPGGDGDDLETRMRCAERVRGTTVGFGYESSGHVDAVRGLRRQADRDAAEARLVALDHQATRAIGVSRGARALVGVLAEDPDRFERVALVLPPGGRAAGRYADWLASSDLPGRSGSTIDILVVGHRGDSGHPVRVAEAWSERLAAQLEILPSRSVHTDVPRIASLLGQFLS